MISKSTPDRQKYGKRGRESKWIREWEKERNGLRVWRKEWETELEREREILSEWEGHKSKREWMNIKEYVNKRIKEKQRERVCVNGWKKERENIVQGSLRDEVGARCGVIVKQNL